MQHKSALAGPQYVCSLPVTASVLILMSSSVEAVHVVAVTVVVVPNDGSVPQHSVGGSVLR